jgi:membrane-associated phospholipid phosphatase
MTIFILFAFIALQMIEKGDILMWLNRHNTSFLDALFFGATKFGEAYPFYLAILVLVFVKYRYALIIPIIGALNPILSGSLKDYFQHPRPYTFYEKIDRVGDLHAIDYVYLSEGMNSFPSGHTLSAFALFSFLAFISKNQYLKCIFFFIAFFVGISRIYLNLHFFEDVILGSICGFLLALAIFLVQEKLFARSLEGSFNRIKKKG